MVESGNFYTCVSGCVCVSVDCVSLNVSCIHGDNSHVNATYNIELIIKLDLSKIIAEVVYLTIQFFRFFYPNNLTFFLAIDSSQIVSEYFYNDRPKCQNDQVLRSTSTLNMTDL